MEEENKQEKIVENTLKDRTEKTENQNKKAKSTTKTGASKVGTNKEIKSGATRKTTTKKAATTKKTKEVEELEEKLRILNSKIDENTTIEPINKNQKEEKRQATKTSSKAEKEKQATKASSKAEKEKQATKISSKTEKEKQATKTSSKAEKEKQKAKTNSKTEKEKQATKTNSKAEKEKQKAKTNTSSKTEKEKQKTKTTSKTEKINNQKKSKKNEKVKELEEQEEQEEIKETKALAKKNNISEEVLEKIKKERKTKQKLQQNQKDNIILLVSKNVVIATAVMAYFVYISIGALWLDSITMVNGLKALSLIMILFSIIVFEVAYKKDSGMLTIHGIEALVLSIATLMLILAYQKYQTRFVGISGSTGLVFTVYYLAKSIIIECKARRKIKKESIEKETKVS